MTATRPTATRPTAHHPARAARRRLGGRPAGRRSGLFLGIAAVVVVLNLVGLVMVLSASSVIGLAQMGSSWHFAQRQVVWVTVAMVVLAVCLRIDYHRWRRLGRPLLLLSVLMLALVLVPGVGVNVNGSTRWLGAGPIQLQPSEFAKLGLLLFCADLLARRIDRVHDLRLSLVPVAVVTGGVCVLVMAQPNLGTTLVLGAIVFSLLFVAGVPLLPLTGVAAGAGVLALGLAMGEGYRRARLTGFLDPWRDPLDTGYQTIQSLVGIAQGGVAGVGLGASRAKWGFLPFAHTDFVFAIIAEETGLIGASVVVLLFVALCWLGIVVALRAPDAFGMLLAA
ncbi:MAG TPA: FtsW/RodA/SpoVE family cell cycle protein, partial [Acidimicrobiales bacterium]|nr:FtsW/RodA/SpoVE family cell cycle protein [Acidimicrobiales bacterium]